jgi:DNA-binding CsgD family transcriptional regulator
MQETPGHRDRRLPHVGGSPSNGIDVNPGLGRSVVAGEVAPPTPAQLRVLELVALGLSSREIGERLSVTRQTVTYHISNLLVALRASTRAGLVARAYASGVLEPGRWPPRASSGRGSADEGPLPSFF